MVSNLGIKELTKYPWRVEHFLSKYKSGQEFELIDKFDIKKVGIIYSPIIAEWIEKEEYSNLHGKILLGNDGQSYKLEDLKKTSEFGGQSCNKKELLEIESINDQLQVIKSATFKDTIPLKLGNVVYDISVCRKIKGNPKADFSLSNEDETSICWGSHKSGNNPDRFQQYSGVTEPTIENHHEVISFIKAIQAKFPSGLKPKTSVGRVIKDIDLQNRAVYGYKYDKLDFGKQNVNFVVQGNVTFNQVGDYYEMGAFDIHLNGEKFEDGYKPILLGRYTTDRHQGVANCRLSISPAKGRKISHYV